MSGATNKKAHGRSVEERLAARDLLADAVNKVGDEAINDIVLPTIERVIHGGIDLVDLAGHDDKGLVRVLRTPGLAYRLKRIGLSDEQAQVALRFSHDFERARIGGLTANYDGFSGGAKRSGEPERWCAAIQTLARASAVLDKDQRVVLYGYVLFDISAADLGAFVAGNICTDINMHKFTGKLLMHKALDKLTLFYEDQDFVRERLENERNSL